MRLPQQQSRNETQDSHEGIHRDGDHIYKGCCENQLPVFESANGDGTSHAKVKPLLQKQKYKYFVFYHVRGKKLYELLLVHREKRGKQTY